MQKDLGSILKIDLRSVWTPEPEFTRWLAEENNLAELGKELGLDLSLIQVEANVGDFNVDILAEETGTGIKAIVENQLEMTDHDHLGKLITYASGHDAGYIVWIFKNVREEHRQAIDWLNEHTTDDVNFFAVKLELWQIGDSKPAPKFDVVCRPNEWAKTVKQQSARGEHSEGKLRQLEFWTQLRAYAEKKPIGITLQSPRPQHWMNVSVGSTDAHIALTINTTKRIMGSELYIQDNKNLFQFLLKEKGAIEQELGAALEWRDKTTGKACRVIQYHPNFDINDSAAYPTQFDWLLDRASAFKKTFAERIKTYQRTV